MGHEEHIIQKQFGKAIYFYDSRSKNKDDILEFIDSKKFKNLEKSLNEETYISLGGDGLFVHIAKLAHEMKKKIIGLNFGNKGFLVQDTEYLSGDTLEFIEKKYPVLKTTIKLSSGVKKIGYAFNEVFLTRSGDASSLELDVTHLGKKIEHYLGDGLMIATPAGSTGWSRSYGGVIIPHGANLNLLTPVGKISPVHLQPLLLSDKGRIRINNITRRDTHIDILLDNELFMRDVKEAFELKIERSSRLLGVLIEKNNLEHFLSKVYSEQDMYYCGDIKK